LVKLASEFPHADLLSEFLRSLRVRSTTYCFSEMTTPWGFRVEAQAVAAFHFVVSGACWIEAQDLDRPIRLQTGDLAVVPPGHAHQVRDDLRSPVRPLQQIIASHASQEGRRLQWGGDGARTQLLCGHLIFEDGAALPPLEYLPPVVHLRSRDGRPAAWLETIIDLLLQEMTAGAPGGEAVVVRLLDLLLAQALRTFEPGLEGALPPAPLVLTDREIATALRLIHDQPHHSWTTIELAKRTAMSRSGFAARFRHLTGEAPMRYLAQYRLARAADLLRGSNATLLDIAMRTGYSSDAALSKAFRRRFGLAPGEYRKANQLQEPATSFLQIVGAPPRTADSVEGRVAG
jgi:AraC-like DNA-binding protein/mannose-6-phosphate isomerase-like protein (cupin superfamily)